MISVRDVWWLNDGASIRAQLRDETTRTDMVTPPSAKRCQDNQGQSGRWRRQFKDMIGESSSDSAPTLLSNAKNDSFPRRIGLRDRPSPIRHRSGSLRYRRRPHPSPRLELNTHQTGHRSALLVDRRPHHCHQPSSPLSPTTPRAAAPQFYRAQSNPGQLAPSGYSR